MGSLSTRTIARAAIAFVALALVLLPGEAWSAAEVDYQADGFDSDLIYSNSMSRTAFDPFVVSQHGSWEPCPCEPGSLVTIGGRRLADGRVESEAGSSELGGVELLVNEEPALLHLVAPSQIDFILPANVTGSTATIELFRNGESVGLDTVAIGEAPFADGASVVSSNLNVDTAAGAEPEVHVITTPLSFRADFTAVIEKQSEDAVPLRMKVWNPRNSSSLEMAFAADKQVYAMFYEAAGSVAREAVLQAYEIGMPYDVTVEWERGQRGAISITDGVSVSAFELSSEEAPALFDAYRPSLTIGAAARNGSSSASLTEYHLELTPARFTTLRVNDSFIPPLMVLLTALGVLFIATLISPQAASRLRESIAAGSTVVRRHVAGHPVATFGIILGVISYIAINFALFTLGSHPFDMGSQSAWSYIAASYGVTDLYYISQTTTLADVWNGVPYHEAVFPYNAGMSYYFWLIGKTHVLIFGNASPDSTSMQLTIKTFNLAFLLADAALIYAIVRHLKPESSRLPWIVAGVVIFNPAVMFDTAIWGETESVVLFPLLASLLAALKDRPGIAWPFLALAFLSKQTVLLPVLAIAVFYLMRFDLRRNIAGFSNAMVVVLLVILPFTLNGYPPSIAIDPTLAGVWAHGGSGAERAFQMVSYDSFNIWTLATFVLDGAEGLARFQTPDYKEIVGSLSYQQLGLISLAVSLVALAIVAFSRWRFVPDAESGIFIAIAMVFALELFLPTQTLSRYYVLAIVFAAIGLAGTSRWPGIGALAAFTVTALVGQWGSIALVLEGFPQHGKHLAPQNNFLSQTMADLFTSDGFITVAVLVNGIAVIALGCALYRNASEGRAVTPARTPIQQISGRLPLPVRGET
jgi:hypothetical protein